MYCSENKIQNSFWKYLSVVSYTVLNLGSWPVRFVVAQALEFFHLCDKQEKRKFWSASREPQLHLSSYF
jgi:hypothetical protein